MSQQKIILEILSDGNWHCSSEFYSSFIADPRIRIFELKKSGHFLIWRWCEQHKHKKSKEWRILGEKAQNATETAKTPILTNQNDKNANLGESRTSQKPLFAFNRRME